MNEFLKIFKKVNGLQVIKQYIKNHLLFYSFFQLILIGHSKKALEILRLSIDYKIYRKMKKKYLGMLGDFDLSYEEIEHKDSNKIWFCWLQGIENAPLIVKLCYDSLKKNIQDKEIVLITKDNMKKYIALPDYIEKKYENGNINNAHYSDLVRIELLTKYGGTWIDSTVWCSSNSFYSYLFESELFLFQTLKPGLDGHSTAISNWFIHAKSNNRILLAVRFLLFEYWKNNDSAHDYYIFHIFFQIVIEYYPKEWAKVMPFDNSIPHILLLRLFEQYDENVFKNISKICPFHKLSYKFEKEKELLENTYYKQLIK